MRVTQKINNNVVIAVDNNGNELVAFGKGLGFPKVPYELKNLDKVEMSFYRLNTHNFQLLKEIPEKIFEISARIATIAQRRLKRRLNPNFLFSLADHINFTILRLRDYKETKMPFSYDIKQLYPEEYKIGILAAKIISQDLKLRLPETEALALAMHFVNAQEATIIDLTEAVFDEIASSVIDIIEEHFPIIIDHNDFSYNRFLMHLRYYLKRLENNEQVTDENNHLLIQTIYEESPAVYRCTIEIVNYIDDKLRTQSTDDEMFYLMIYVKRMVSKSAKRKEDSDE